MVLSLSNLGNKKKVRKRLGRGNASGRGNYSTRGMKGQRSRSGGKGGLKLRGFKQNLLNLPKYKGIKSIRPNNQVVKLSKLVALFDGKDQINPGSLFEKGVISDCNKPAKILVDQKDIKIDNKYEIVGVLLSKNAKTLLEKAGSKIIMLESVIEKQSKKAEEKTKK